MLEQFELNEQQLLAVEVAKANPIIFDYGVAVRLREVWEKYPNLIELTPGHELNDIERYDARDRLAYFKAEIKSVGSGAGYEC